MKKRQGKKACLQYLMSELQARENLGKGCCLLFSTGDISQNKYKGRKKMCSKISYIFVLHFT